jgi:chromosomal replication initiation ATPase DnaA
MRILAQGQDYYIRASIHKTRFGVVPYQVQYSKMESIVYKVSLISGKHVNDLITKCRAAEEVEWRMLITYICREKEYGSFKAIGQLLGGRHYSSIINAYQKAQDLLEANDKQFMFKFNSVKHLLK